MEMLVMDRYNLPMNLSMIVFTNLILLPLPQHRLLPASGLELIRLMQVRLACRLQPHLIHITLVLRLQI